ncbi:MAG: hypothetical protein H0X40_08690 [Chthoniobacterales bacterium]|nr:hypothetical protein [Chthoniobacterales bacterium]
MRVVSAQVTAGPLRFADSLGEERGQLALTSSHKLLVTLTTVVADARLK